MKSKVTLNGIEVVVEADSAIELATAIKEMVKVNQEESRQTPGVTVVNSYVRMARNRKNAHEVTKKPHGNLGGKRERWTEGDIVRLARLAVGFGERSRGVGEAAVKVIKEQGDIQNRKKWGTQLMAHRIHRYVHRGVTSSLNKGVIGTLTKNGFSPLRQETSRTPELA